MRRDIASRLSLLLSLSFLFSLNATPWRPKNPVRLATSLPTRIIDSIMAQGNWNILFQEGPFAEFQRQIAVANHFALRGDQKAAEQYFARAENSLEIAYASLRGRFGWPRLANTLIASELPWGENRDTFSDYLLCRLQLYLENALRRHDGDELLFTNFETVISDYQKQLGSALQKKDAELETFIRLVRESLAVRALRPASAYRAAERFAALSDSLPYSVQGYWPRRAYLFRIVENIHYGNLGRAQHYARQLAKNPEKADPLAIARMLIGAGDFPPARLLLESGLAGETTRLADNYPDYLRYAETLESLLVWQRDYRAAEQVATRTTQHLEKLLNDNAVPREEIVEFRMALENQKLRRQKLAYLATGTCPAPASDIQERDIEWQVRERLFEEHCGLKPDREWWRAILKSADKSAEVRLIAAYRLHDEKAALEFLDKQGNNDATGELGRYLRARVRLAQALERRQKTNLAALLADYLRSANELSADFLFTDWGVRVADDLAAPAGERLAGKMSARDAFTLFGEMHRRYALTELRGKPIQYFAPPDAAELSRRIALIVLERRPAQKAVVTATAFTGFDLVLEDGSVSWRYDAARGSLNTGKPSQVTPGARRILMGNPLLAGTATGTGILPPLFYFCAECTPEAERVSRLAYPLRAEEKLPATIAELSDAFSSTPDSAAMAVCQPAESNPLDTLLVYGTIHNYAQLPCDLHTGRLVAIAARDNPASAAPVMLAMGWRRGLHSLTVPADMPETAQVAFLYDMFHRTNRKKQPVTEAFTEAKVRAEKSFPEGRGLESLQIYGSLP